VERGKAAMAATTQFLLPHLPGHDTGWQSLRPTMGLDAAQRDCDYFEGPAAEKAKKVHALGTFAAARWKIYGGLTKLGVDDLMIGNLPNPYTGLLAPRKDGGSVPFFIRFSIANPVAGTIGSDAFRLSLEFIPGVGMKFPITGRRSVDLLAMESLAGQGKDHNYFKYEFSPDFSRHAPPDLNAGTGETLARKADRDRILKRYDQNSVNKKVMNLVGKRFAQVIPETTGMKREDLDFHSDVGPHGFVISIAELAKYDVDGTAYDEKDQRRPWRLVFKPALSAAGDRFSKITASEPYAPGRYHADFRHKLAYLQPGDRVFQIIAETRAGTRYLMGEITLDSAPYPSDYADLEFFTLHRLEMGRRPPATTIVEPAL
jgi:hypothetical protein